MKKKSILAIVLACSMAFGTAAMAGCDIISGDTTGGGTQQQPENPTDVKVTGVEISKQTAQVAAGGSFKLTASVLPENATNKKIIWSSSATAVATVDGEGNVSAIKEGSAIITAASEDGAKTATCTVTVTKAGGSENPGTDPVKTYTVKFYSEGSLVGTTTVNSGAKVEAPADVEKSGYYIAGWTTSSTSGAVYDFTQGVTGNLELHAKWEKITGKISYTYAGKECAAFEWGDANPAKAKVQYKLSSASAYTDVDAQLVRSAKTSGFARVDIVGLKGGAQYDFKVTTSSGENYTVSNMTVSSYDRSGYAHFNYSSGVGAYNDDGTPKANANIVYVTEATKNTVKATIDGKTYTGLVSILQNAGTKTPLIVRILGTVGAATWNKLEENGGKPLTPDKVVGVNGKVLTKKNWTQQELIDGGYNTLNTSVYSELKGLSSRIKYDSSKSEFDSCWNDCSIQNVKNVTVEGIGEDARIFQWGMTFKSSSSIEVRNLTFEDYTEDACSFESGETSAASLSEFKHGNIWLHNNTFEEGVNYWDVCNEQDKHDGDGSTDFKGIKNITISYNVYNNTHKTGLIGGSNSQTTASVTFHHNAYNNCKARLPLARQANMHMYNNYYNGTTSCDISLRANAYALVENCYFESKNNTPVELQHDSKYGDGWAKVIGCTITESKISVKDGVNKSTNLYVGADRAKKLNTANKYGSNFDTESAVFYYANGKSDVAEMLTAAQVKTEIPKVAGVQKHVASLGGGTVSGGESGGETPTDPDTPDPDTPDTPDTPSGSVTYTYSYAKLEGVSSLGDNAALSQANFIGDNAFLIIGDGVTLRNGTKDFIQSINDGLAVEFKGTGTITVTFGSTGSTNESHFGLKNSQGVYLPASSVGSGITALDSGDDNGCYSVTGTAKSVLTFTVTQKGKYYLCCPNGITNRGARIYAVVMTDNV